MGHLTVQNQYFSEGINTDFVGVAPPTSEPGELKDASHNGFFIYAITDYILWFKDAGGTWNEHQQISSIDPTARTFSWGDNSSVYIQATEAAQVFYITGREGPLLIDNTPTDGSDTVDTLVLNNSTSLRIFGPANAPTQTETAHIISDAAPVTIDTPNEGTIQVIEDTSDYTDSLSSKLAAYYNFNDENANDLTIGENHGTADAGCVYVNGKSGLSKALHQTSNSAHVALNNADILDLGANFTVAAWIYVPSTQSPTGLDNPYNDVAVFSNRDSYGDWTYISGFILAVGKPGYASGWSMPSNSLNLYAGCGSGNGIYSWASFAVGTPHNSFPYDEWVHIALTASDTDQPAWGANVKLFLNGQVQALDPRSNQPTQNPIEWSTDPLTTNLGASWTRSQPSPLATSGELMYDEIAIWKRELSESEISDLYNGGSGVELDTTYVVSETVRSDFTVTTAVTVEAPSGTDNTNIKVRITK